MAQRFAHTGSYPQWHTGPSCPALFLGPNADFKCGQEKKRSFIVVVGDRAKDVIVHLHYIMSSVDIKQNKSVLWAYKKNLLGFTRSVKSSRLEGGRMLIRHPR